MTVIETERLVLRHLSTEDAGFILELLNEPSFIRNIGDRGVRTIEGANTYILNGPVASYARNGFGLYLVKLKETDESIGMCGLIKRDTLDDVDIGYALLPRFWSKGYAVEIGTGRQRVCEEQDWLEADRRDRGSRKRRLDPRPREDRTPV